MKTLLRTILLLILSIGISLANCSCDLLNPKNDSLPLWKVQIFSGALALLQMNPHIWNGNTLFLGEKSGKTTLFLIDNTTGKIKWEWDDFLISKDEVSSDDEQYLFQNNFCFQTLVGVYLVDMNAGKTLRKTPLSQQGGGHSIQGLGSTFFNCVRGSVLNQGNMNDGQFKEIFSLPQEPDFRVSIQTPVPFIAPNQDTLLILDIAKLRLRDATIRTRIALYNLTKQTFVYDSLRPPNGSGAMPQIYNNRIYQEQGISLVCNDLWTGRELWRREFGNSFLGYGFSIKDGKIFATNGDSNLYCLDAETGRELWRKTRVAFDTPAPFVMNGVVYVAGGVLWAFDTNTGDELWKRTSQDDTGFRGRVNGADGKVYAYTRQNAYCYKAAR